MSLHKRASQKKKTLMKKKQKKLQAANSCMSVHMLLEDNFEGYQGNGLYDPNHKQYRIFTIEKQSSLAGLLQVLADATKYAVEQIRPWSVCLPSRRPSPINIEQDLHREVSEVANNQNPWIIFLEVVLPDSDLLKLPRFDTGGDVLLFFKMYDPKNKRLHYCGHQYSPVNSTVEELIPLLNRRAGFKTDTPLALYEETESSEIEKIVNMRDTLDRQLENTNESVIIVFQKDTLRDDDDDLYTCEDFYRELPHRVDVTFCDKTIRDDPGIDVTLSLRMNYREVSEAVAERVATEPHLLQLFNSDPSRDRPGAAVLCTFDGTLKQLLQSHNSKIQHTKIFYCKLCIPVNELEERKTIKCTWFGRASNEGKEITLYPTAAGTVADLLEEAKKKVDLSAGGSGKLRLLEVKQRKIVSVLKEPMPLENLKLRGNKTFRIEEIPLDEINLAADEQLTPVAQFFKTNFSSAFGFPLLIKVKHMEPFTSVKKRILEKLEISENKSEEFQVFLFTVKKPHTCDMSECINIDNFEWHQTEDNSTPLAYLGFQHLKDNRVRFASK